MTALLALRGLTIEAGDGPLVHTIDLELAAGRILGLVGESGSGKSLTVMSIPGLLPSGCRVSAGEIVFDGRDIVDLSEDQMRPLRGRDIGVVFQDPFTSLNPVRRVGSLLEEALRRHTGVSARVARDRVIEALDQVGLPDPVGKARAYPHQMSGGQRQRALIALALVNNPRLLIADEPTTALDATVQVEILDVLRRSAERVNGAVVFVTHDLGAAAYICDEIAVMRGGRIVEHGLVQNIIARPTHPYTKELLACSPRLPPRKDNRGQP
ncbi:ABC transporter ATP-binding protein [Brevundimonas sp. UBA2416]|jgi:ABC-type glutathione transport system ATPase component|uniref:ABC transporter ATP-binding protein n=1 Tax=Brevundimonas sp. UBA2416 TaxID=1946124 RepID=UPI0025C35060|nr:ABC transporter ATP-binding protein [Brevundimonas sp. UBA2416]